MREGVIILSARCKRNREKREIDGKMWKVYNIRNVLRDDLGITKYYYINKAKIIPYCIVAVFIL